MTVIADLLKDKTVKPKEKTEAISNMLLDGSLTTRDLISFAATAKDPAKATCIEALEFATKQDPTITGNEVLAFVTASLAAKAPRVKWESAKVIGNIAHRFPDKLADAIKNLLVNTEDAGTVVRWSAAYALGEIVKLKTKHNNELLPAIAAICEREEKNSIRKIYVAAVKVLKK